MTELLAFSDGSGVALNGLRLLFEGTLKGSVLVLAAAAACLALRRSSAAMRHLAWTAAIVGLLLVVPVSRLLPVWPVTLPEPLRLLAETARRAEQEPRTREAGEIADLRARTASGSESISRAPSPVAVEQQRSVAAEAPGTRSSRVGLAGRLLLAWMVGAAVLAASFLAAALRLARVLRTATPVDDVPTIEIADSAARELGLARRRFRLCWTERPLTPMTWGLFRPVILLPRTSIAWTDERLRQVLVHEIAHVLRRDALTQSVSVLACVVYWFNPLVWWAARQLLVERERACDDCVLRDGAKASTYAHELLEIARVLGARWTAARVSPAMARRSQISGRLLAVLDPDLPRSGVSRAAVVASALTCAALTVPLATLVPARVGGEVPVAATTAITDTIAPAPAPAPIAAAARADLDEARNGLAAAQRALVEALGRRDAATMAEIYATDAVSVAPGILPLRGRRAIQDAMEQLLEQGIVGIESHSTELYVVGDKVCETGRATFRTVSGRNAAMLRFMTLWKKEGGRWRIYRGYVTPEEVGR